MCLTAGLTILTHVGPSGIPYYKTLDKDYVERGFAIERNGRKYVGKLDLVAIKDDGSYSVVDYKTGKTAPDDWKLKSDLQFSMYAYATYSDPNMARTVGRFMERGVYLHLRGKSLEKVASGLRAKSVKDTKDKSLIQYSVPVKRTEEQIEPVMGLMEAGAWFRNIGDDCKWCGFWNKDKQRCEVEIPLDATEKVKELEAKRLDHKPAPTPNDEPQMLFDKSVVTESRKAGLKPYS
jgi:hypothetical protein